MTRTNINTVAARIRRAKTKLRAILEERGHV
jgi:DNA-directed RNA polymerase specialized sigma24 family protein